MPPLVNAVPDLLEPPNERAPSANERPAWSFDATSMSDVVAEEWATLVRLAALLLGDRAPAEDVVQDVCEATWRKRPTVASRDHLVGYLRVGVVNRCRSAGRRRTTAARHLTLLRQEARDEHAPGADAPALAAERRAEVLSALAELGDRQREVLVLRYWADLSESEIAEAMSVTRGTVKSTAHHALNRLTDLLGGAR